MQAHHADHSTNTEVGVMNNFERVQNVNTGNTQGKFIWTISSLNLPPAFQQVLSFNKSLIMVCDKHKMLLTSIIFHLIVVDLGIQITLQTIEDKQLGIYASSSCMTLTNLSDYFSQRYSCMAFST